MINILFVLLLILSFNSCSISNKNTKNTTPLIVQEMNDDNVIILSDKAPNDFKSFLFYVRQKIYLNLRRYIYARGNKIQGKVNVVFIISPNGNVKILKLSGAKSLYSATYKIIKKSFPVFTNAKQIKELLPKKINVTLDYNLYNINPPSNQKPNPSQNPTY